MNAVRLIQITAFCPILALPLLSSCASTNSKHSTEAVINRDAGRGNFLLITVRLGNDEALPLVVDTGSPSTVLDNSLEPKLGEKIGEGDYSTWGRKRRANAYVAPALYLGKERLLTYSNVITADLSELSHNCGHRIMGILGMDCLRNHCVQFDCQTSRLRLLNPEHLNNAKLGKSYHLNFSSEGQSEKDWVRAFIRQATLVGGEPTDLMIDTGLNIEGALNPTLFDAAIQSQRLQALKPSRVSVNEQGNERGWLPECTWNNETYTNLVLCKGYNIIGLRFLARHLVTLNFPKKTMYLKKRSQAPLTDMAERPSKQLSPATARAGSGKVGS